MKDNSRPPGGSPKPVAHSLVPGTPFAGQISPPFTTAITAMNHPDDNQLY
jgi:hypothetical protein